MLSYDSEPSNRLGTYSLSPSVLTVQQS